MSIRRLVLAGIRLLEKQSHNTTATATLHLVQKLNIPVTTGTVFKTLEQHPHYPSLLSISDSLTKWNIANIALRVKPETLDELPTPFIAHTKRKRGFVMVSSINGVVEYVDQKGRPQVNTKEEFIKLWDNVVLLAEQTERSGDSAYETNKRKELLHNLRIPFILLACLGLMVMFAISTWEVYAIGIPLLLIKFAGCIIGSLLLWFELDNANPVLKQFCTAGKKTNCTAVLGSKAAKLFNAISWSEIGFFYFVGGFLFLLINANKVPAAFSLLAWINILALPYPLFSVYYQWKIAKQWCPMCLAIQALLLLEFVTGYFGYWSSFEWPFMSTGMLIGLLTALLAPVFFWTASKRAYLQSEHVNQFRKDLGRVAYNKDVLHSLLSKQKAITEPTEGLGITIGDPRAATTIVKVCNPFCGPCSKAHPVIDEIVDLNPDVKVQIIFSGIKDYANDKINRVVSHLMALNARNDSSLMKQALDDWYINMKANYDIFTAKYPLLKTDKTQDVQLMAMKHWCDEIDIAFTPTFFVDGNQLPEMYKLEDLKSIL